MRSFLDLQLKNPPIMEKEDVTFSLLDSKAYKCIVPLSEELHKYFPSCEKSILVILAFVVPLLNSFNLSPVSLSNILKIVPFSDAVQILFPSLELAKKAE
jgi:hypothetical protein